ncbi:MAG: class I SAM-dependent rRNA methyltransferase [Treponema sp.]|nr:class I SAM-dependent rRNA methyltransferase [Treponema sp.]
MNFPRVFLKKNEEKEIKGGFLWAFDNELGRVKYFEGNEWKECQFVPKESDNSVPDQKGAAFPIKDGELVELYTNAGAFLASGIFNRASKITVRLLGAEKADQIDADRSGYIFKKIFDALNLRKIHFDTADSYRLVFGEADFLPGFICERYAAEGGKVYLLVQFLSMSCEVFRKEIIAALEKSCEPFAIYERSDADVRLKEGLELKSGWIKAPKGGAGEGSATITIVENSVRIQVDMANGQKTGYFLDQKFNRKEIWKYCRGKSVFDAFSHTGAFGLNAFFAGAKSVVCADISQDAVDLINTNIKLNGAEKVVSAVCAVVFDLLKKYEADGQKFDVIILDPPAFTKSAKMIKKAYGGYKEINLRAMRILVPGGILVTCSCSHFFDETNFYSMLAAAASDSHRRVQILSKGGAAPDHPVLLGYPKSEYLKRAICKVQ